MRGQGLLKRADLLHTTSVQRHSKAFPWLPVSTSLEAPTPRLLTKKSSILPALTDKPTFYCLATSTSFCYTFLFEAQKIEMRRLTRAKEETMVKGLRVAVLGCGSIAQHCHLPGYTKNKYADIVAVADPVKARLREVRRQFPVGRTYADWRKLLAKEELDALSICTPNYLHAQMALAALDRGLHVLCEKPMTITLDDAKKVRQAARKARTVFMVGFTHRFLKGNIRAKKLLDDGAIGEPFMLRVRFAHGGPYPGWAKDDWFYSPREAGGGALLDMGIHAMDLARFYIGEVATVSAELKTLRKRIRVDDNALVIMTFKGRNALGYIEVGWTSRPGFTDAELYGDDGTIYVDYVEGLKVLRGRTLPSGKVELRRQRPKVTVTDGGWAVEVDHFIDCIRKGKIAKAGVEDGYQAVRIACAAYESARRGKRIRL